MFESMAIGIFLIFWVFSVFSPTSKINTLFNDIANVVLGQFIDIAYIQKTLWNKFKLILAYDSAPRIMKRLVMCCCYTGLHVGLYIYLACEKFLHLQSPRFRFRLVVMPWSADHWRCLRPQAPYSWPVSMHRDWQDAVLWKTHHVHVTLGTTNQCLYWPAGTGKQKGTHSHAFSSVSVDCVEVRSRAPSVGSELWLYH